MMNNVRSAWDPFPGPKTTTVLYSSGKPAKINDCELEDQNDDFDDLGRPEMAIYLPKPEIFTSLEL